MKFKYSEDIGAVTVSAAQLASFARKRRSVSERIVLREIERRPAGAAPGVKYASAAERNGAVLAVADTADFVYPDAVEIVREGKKSALTDAALLAEICIFGHLFCREHGKKSVRLILTLISPKGEEKHFTADADADFLSGAFDALLARAFPFAEIIACEKSPGFCERAVSVLRHTFRSARFHKRCIPCNKVGDKAYGIGSDGNR